MGAKQVLISISVINRITNLFSKIEKVFTTPYLPRIGTEQVDRSTSRYRENNPRSWQRLHDMRTNLFSKEEKNPLNLLELTGVM